MRYFTNNPLERLMMQKPKAAREDSPPDAAKEHFCYGCKRFGQSCVRPCYGWVVFYQERASGDISR